ncbi:helix-turn-helix domain-containing protein [Kitasatospora sp. NPDC088391]|uniref:helix-turn-helix domain-containing protein n=1 Tax=Kitasatospora sp. NPDC088391 TaxID=3364074 RepID=UPI0037F2C984
MVDAIGHQLDDPRRPKPPRRQRRETGGRLVGEGPAGDEVLGVRSAPAGSEQVAAAGRADELGQDVLPALACDKRGALHTGVDQRMPWADPAQVPATSGSDLPGHQPEPRPERHQGQRIASLLPPQVRCPVPKSRQLVRLVRVMRIRGCVELRRDGLAPVGPGERITDPSKPGAVGLHRGRLDAARAGQDVGVDYLSSQPGVRIAGQAIRLGPQRQRGRDVQEPLGVVGHRGDRGGDDRAHERRHGVPGGRCLAGPVAGDLRGRFWIKDHDPRIPAGQAADRGLIHFNGQDGASMVGGSARVRPPRDLTEDPEAWPRLVAGDVGAEVVRNISGRLAEALTGQELSLRQVAAGAGVNRQAIADLLAGRSWPDVATVARLEHFLNVPLYPHRAGARIAHGEQPSRPRRQRSGNDEIGHAPPEASVLALTSGVREPVDMGPREGSEAPAASTEPVPSSLPGEEGTSR